MIFCFHPTSSTRNTVRINIQTKTRIKARTYFQWSLAALLVCGASMNLSARAATMKISPAAAQPGDVLTISVYPQSGEKIVALSMSAFDTKDVKFYLRSDGIARAFVGFPFDRKGGTQTLQARVRVEKQTTTRVGTPDIETSEQIVTTRFVARDRYYPTQRIRMNNSNAGTMNKTAKLRAEKLYVQSKMKNSYPAPLWRGAWVVPTRGASTSAYGRRRYVNGKWWGQHNGADIKAPSGAPIVASNSGRVVLSEYLPDLRGNCTVIDHGCNVFSLYLHQSERLVRVGQNLQKGQLIGRVGATGFVTGPHLHWEVRIGWEPVDPSRVLARGLQF